MAIDTSTVLCILLGTLDASRYVYSWSSAYRRVVSTFSLTEGPQPTPIAKARREGGNWIYCCIAE